MTEDERAELAAFMAKHDNVRYQINNLRADLAKLAIKTADDRLFLVLNAIDQTARRQVYELELLEKIIDALIHEEPKHE